MRYKALIAVLAASLMITSSFGVLFMNSQSPGHSDSSTYVPDSSFSLFYGGVTPNEVYLYWDATQYVLFSEYEVQVSKDGGGSWNTVQTISSQSQTNYFYNDGSPSATYDFQVLSVGNDGSSTSTSSIATVPFKASSVVSYSTISSTEISLSWTNNAYYGDGVGFIDYQVMESVNGGSFTAIDTITSVDTLTYDASNMNPGSTYSFYIVTNNGWSGTSPPSYPAPTDSNTVTYSVPNQQYTVTFTESGLSGQQWSVTFDGQSKSTTSSSLSFTVSPGQYSYSVSPPSGYTANPSSGSISVSGDQTVGIQFSYGLATVTFSESGIGTSATGTVLTVDGTAYDISQLPISFSWAIGSSHSFQWGTTVSQGSSEEYVWDTTSGLSSQESGSVTVPSGGGKVSATYSPFYQITFSVNPYNYGTFSWSGGGNVGGSTGTSYSSNYYYAGQQISISAQPSSSSYQFTGWTSTSGISLGSTTSSSTTATVRGVGTVTADFSTTSASAYTVTFTESGLSGQQWRVILGNKGIITSGSDITFTVQESSYQYSISDVAGMIPNVSSGTLDVSGNSNVQVNFVNPTFSSNLYNGTNIILLFNANQAAYLNIFRNEGSDSAAFYLINYVNNPTNFPVYNIFYQNGSGHWIHPITNAQEQAIYNMLIWSQVTVWNKNNLLEQSIQQDQNYNQQLVNNEWKQESGIVSADLVDIASIIAPIVSEMQSVLGSQGAQQISTFATLIMHAIEGSKSLDSLLGSLSYVAISTFESFGLITGSNFNGPEFLYALANLPLDKIQPFIMSIESNVYNIKPSPSISEDMYNFMTHIGTGIMTLGVNAAASGLQVFMDAYFGSELTLSTSSLIGASAIIGSVTASIGTVMIGYAIPLALASVVIKGYIMPNADLLQTEVNIQNTLEIIYNSILQLFSQTLENGVNYVGNTNEIFYSIGLTNSLMHEWYQADYALTQGEYLQEALNYKSWDAQLQMDCNSAQGAQTSYLSMYSSANNFNKIAQQLSSLNSGASIQVNVWDRTSVVGDFSSLSIDATEESLPLTNPRNYTSLIEQIPAINSVSIWNISKETSLSTVFSNYTITLNNTGVLDGNYADGLMVSNGYNRTIVLFQSTPEDFQFYSNANVTLKVSAKNASSQFATAYISVSNETDIGLYLGNSTGKFSLHRSYDVVFHMGTVSGDVYWKVSVSGIGTYESKSSTLVLQLPNGTYNYSISFMTPGTYTPLSGTFYVNGYTTSVDFTPAVVPQNIIDDYAALAVLAGFLILACILVARKRRRFR